MNLGSSNTACGLEALGSNTSGSYNTSVGYMSLEGNSTGSFNTAIGYGAFNTGSIYTNSTGIGYDAQPGASNKIMIGNTSVTWIGGYTTWSNASDERMKTNINEDVIGLDFILNLRPVTYNFDKNRMDEIIGIEDVSDYPEKYDVETIKQSGFLAQEVEEAATKAGYDFSGITKPEGDVKYYSLAYAEFVIPLVKAVQEQQEIIINQDTKIEKLQEELNEIKAFLKELK